MSLGLRFHFRLLSSFFLVVSFSCASRFKLHFCDRRARRPRPPPSADAAARLHFRLRLPPSLSLSVPLSLPLSSFLPGETAPRSSCILPPISPPSFLTLSPSERRPLASKLPAQTFRQKKSGFPRAAECISSLLLLHTAPAAAPARRPRPQTGTALSERASERGSGIRPRPARSSHFAHRGPRNAGRTDLQCDEVFFW